MQFAAQAAEGHGYGALFHAAAGRYGGHAVCVPIAAEENIPLLRGEGSQEILDGLQQLLAVKGLILMLIR